MLSPASVDVKTPPEVPQQDAYLFGVMASVASLKAPPPQLATTPVLPRPQHQHLSWTATRCPRGSTAGHQQWTKSWRVTLPAW